VKDDFVYFVKGQSMVVCELLTGIIIWRTKLGSTIKEPIVKHLKSVAYVFDDSNVKAIESNTGKTLWTLNVDERIIDLQIKKESNLIFVATSFNILSVEGYTGKVLWENHFNRMISLCEVKISDKIVTVHSRLPGTVYAFDYITGKLVWQIHEDENLELESLISEDSLFLKSPDKIVVFDLISGNMKWYRRGPYRFAKYTIEWTHKRKNSHYISMIR